MGGEEVDSRLVQPKPHVVVLTVPAPGHIFPSIALGKALARQGVKVTFLSSGCVPEKLRRGVEEEEEEELDMTLGTVLEDPLSEPESVMELVPWLSKLPHEEMAEHAYQVIRRLSSPPCCFITDVFIPWTKLLEEKLSIPRHFLITMSASSLSFMFSVPHFADHGLLPLEPAAGVELPVPGVGDVGNDVWEYLVKGSPFQLDAMILCLKDLTESFPTATYFVNSTEELEPKAFRALKAPVPFTGKVARVVSVGPLEQLFAYKGGEEDSIELISEAEMRKELSSEVEEWLDAQPDNSVIYISFGTIFSLQAEQILELAHGLEASGQRFVWIIRLPKFPHIMVSKQPTKEEISAILPPGFEERTKGRGVLYSSWAPQPKILSHRAVGLFMSHCGWNSILEAISTSTPILGHPCFVDQWLNATTLEEQFQIGTVFRDGEGGFERERIATCIRHMMEGEEGKAARRNVAKLNKVLRDAVKPSSGTSPKNLEQFVGEL